MDSIENKAVMQAHLQFLSIAFPDSACMISVNPTIKLYVQTSFFGLFNNYQEHSVQFDFLLRFTYFMEDKFNSVNCYIDCNDFGITTQMENKLSLLRAGISSQSEAWIYYRGLSAPDTQEIGHSDNAVCHTNGSLLDVLVNTNKYTNGAPHTFN